MPFAPHFPHGLLRDWVILDLAIFCSWQPLFRDYGAVGATEAGGTVAPGAGPPSPGPEGGPPSGESWPDPPVPRGRHCRCQGVYAVDLGGAGE